jgi:hypothetical protein
MLSFLFYALSPHLPRIVVSLPERNRRSRARSPCTHECYQFPPRSRRKCEYARVVFLNYSVAGPPQIDERCERKSFVPRRPEKRTRNVRMTTFFTGYMLADPFFSSKKGLSGEENMVLGHIQAAANQGDPNRLITPTMQFNPRRLGIWTKHLKAKTELHQTVIDRCLKSLVQKQLIKSVKGVKVRRTVIPHSNYPEFFLGSIQHARFT